jgi:hypothetical protein
LLSPGFDPSTEERGKGRWEGGRGRERNLPLLIGGNKHESHFRFSHSTSLYKKPLCFTEHHNLMVHTISWERQWYIHIHHFSEVWEDLLKIVKLEFKGEQGLTNMGKQRASHEKNL